MVVSVKYGVMEDKFVCGSESKLLRDNQTISPDGGKGQTKDDKLVTVRTERAKSCLE